MPDASPAHIEAPMGRRRSGCRAQAVMWLAWDSADKYRNPLEHKGFRRFSK